MNIEDHITRHEELHRHLDELAADYLEATGRRLGDTTVLELIQWSHRQTLAPSTPNCGCSSGTGAEAGQKPAVCPAP